MGQPEKIIVEQKTEENGEWDEPKSGEVVVGRDAIRNMYKESLFIGDEGNDVGSERSAVEDAKMFRKICSTTRKNDGTGVEDFLECVRQQADMEDAETFIKLFRSFTEEGNQVEETARENAGMQIFSTAHKEEKDNVEEMIRKTEMKTAEKMFRNLFPTNNREEEEAKIDF